MRIFNALLYVIKKWGKLEREYRQDVLSLFNPDPDAKLLDVGCGDGDFTLMVANKIGTKKIFGIDVMKASIDKAIDKGVNGYQADFDGAALPFEEGYFDVVCANQIIEHLADTDTFVKEILRVLKPGGYAVISTPNLAAWHCIFFLLLGWQSYYADVSDVYFWAGRPHSFNEEKIGGQIPHHRRVFTLRALREFLRYYGFQVEEIKSSGFFPLPVWVARIFCKLDKIHATNITVKVRKIMITAD